MGAVTNREIVEGLRAGKREAAASLMDLYHRRLIGEAVRVFAVPLPDAEEVVDDVLLAVVRGIGRFAFRRGDGDFHVWVMTIFRNRMCDFMRRSAVAGGLMVSFDEALTAEGGEQTGIEREVMREIVRCYVEDTVQPATRAEGGAGQGPLAALERALDGLESWERVLLRCRALDVPYEEIAGYTGKRAEILKAYHPRVRKKLLALLQREQEPDHATASAGHHSPDRLP